MADLFDQIQEATAAIRKRWAGTPVAGIVLGTGLGNLAATITDAHAIAYEDIPHFPRATVASHKGQLVCGTLAGKTVVAMEGRFHAYEGYSPREVTFPVRVMKALGCNTLIATNACGGMNPTFRRGDIMLIDDHINLPGLIGVNALTGPNDERLGERFPDLCHVYDRELLTLAHRVAREQKLSVQQGVYVAVAGPCLETRAEYRFLRAMGADAVGMSTVPEIIVGAHAKMRNVGLSVITDMCLPDTLEPVSLSEIIAAANDAEPRLSALVRGIVAGL